MTARLARPARRLAALTGAAALSVAGCTAEPQTADPGSEVDEFHHLHGLAVPAWGDGTVYMATHEGLIAIGGDEWSYASEELHDFMGFSVHPTEDGVMFSSGHPAPGSDLTNPLGFMTSTDSGASWEVVALSGEVDFHAMSVGAEGSVYGFNGHGEAGIYTSFDGGQSWERHEPAVIMESGGVYSLAADPVDPQSAWAGTATGLFRSDDGGASWEPVNEGSPVTAVTVVPSGDRVIAYGADGVGLIVSDDGGQNWEETGWVLDDSEDAVGHLAVDPSDPDVMWAGTYNADLYRSTDGGATWEAKATAGTPAK
ncbi:hypothetical protein GCM10027447_33360 [Glycomyces halotolerans]